MGEWSFKKPTTCVQITGLFWLCVIQYEITYFAAFHFDEVLVHGEICFGLVIFRGEMMSICYINSAKNHI